MNITELSDAELLRRTEFLAFQERVTDADLIEHLAEIERREMKLGPEYASLYEYCVYRLKMSDGSAYRRIRAARTSCACPRSLELLRAGKLTVESMVMLHPFAKEPGFGSLVASASGLRTRQLEALLALRQTEAPRRDVIRFVGVAPASGTPPPAEGDLFQIPTADAATSDSRTASPATSAAVPTAPSTEATRRVRFAFTADEDFYRMLERARSVLRHKYPDGRLDRVLGDALKALLERRDPAIRWNRPQKPKAAKLRA